MKLFNFKEFKENSASEVTLQDYLSYLHNSRLEVEEAMATAKELGVDEIVSSELVDKLEFIDKLLEIIAGNKKDIIKQTIDRLSLEDLQALYEDKIGVYEREKGEAETKFDFYDSEISKAEKAYDKKMSDNGYASYYYDEEDTADFFELPVSAHDYVKAIFEKEDLDEEDLKQRLYASLHFEAKKTDKTSDDSIMNHINDNIINCMIDGIVSLLVKCHKLNKMLSDKSEYIVNSLLTDNGINKIVVEFFGEDITENLFLDIQNIDREKYSFFNKLPKSVQDKLKDERMSGECYKGLFNYYYALVNETVSDFKPYDTTELDNLYEEKAKVKSQIELINSKIELEKEFIQDEAKLRDYLKSQIDLEDTVAPTFKRLDNFVQLAQGGKEKEIARLSQIDEEMENNTNVMNRIEEILNTDAYVEEPIEDEQSVLSPKELLEPFVEAETARYDQISIMINAQRDLEVIREEINNLKAKKIKNALSKSHKQKLAKYRSEYDIRVSDAFSELDREVLTLVEAPEIIIDKQSGKASISPAKNKVPKNFDDLSYTAHSFWNLEEYIDEIVENGLASEEDITKLITIQKHCVNKLFDYSKDEDGMYQFSITDEEREILLKCQESIVLMARSLYQNRCLMDTIQSRTKDSMLDEETISELRGLGFESFAKEDLQRELFSLTVKNNSLKDEREAIMAQCEDSMIEGINSVEEAIMYRDMLIGINEYYVPTDEIIDVLKTRK